MNNTTCVSLTNDAVEHMLGILASDAQALGIRLDVIDAGCSGKQYKLDFAYDIDKQQDLVVESGNLKLFVNKDITSLLEGTQIYCHKEGINEYIKFRNPNAVNECGCGESFQVK